MVRNGRGRNGEQRWLCKSCHKTSSNAVEQISIDRDLAKAARSQGIDITKLSNSAIAEAVDFDELPYSLTSYKDAMKLLEKFKLNFHFELAKAIAIELDLAHQNGREN